MKGHIRKRGNKYCIVIDIGPDPETGKEDRSGFLDIRQKRSTGRCSKENYRVE